jgi:hypothetical protein
VPRRFSNAFGSASTSLGLYVAQELYAFRGTASGQGYRSVGLRLAGVSGGFNSNARARGVVAHGAPYVTRSGAGRSEGCPAVDPARASGCSPSSPTAVSCSCSRPTRGGGRPTPGSAAAPASPAGTASVSAAG